MNKVKNRDAKLGTVERTMKKTGKIDRVTHERKAAHRNSQSCRLNGRDCGGADCEAEEYAVKMAYKHQKTIKALRGQLKQQSRAKTTILAKEHRRYHNQIKVLKAALDDAKNDLDAVENRAWTEPHELKTHASTTMARVNFRSVLQRNELLEKKARIGDEYKKELRIASENLERARWTVKELKREADILNNKITSKDRKINALEEEAEAVRQVQRVIEDENISQKQELEAAEKRHQEASAKYKHDYENYQQMCIESFDIERKTNEQLRETVEALEPRMLGTKPRDQIIQTTVDDLQARLNKAEALNKDHHQEIENMVQRAAVSKAGYKGEILDLTRRLEEQHRLTADHPPTSHELSVNEDMLQDRINLLQDKVDASERWQVEASRLNDELTRKLNQAGADIQSMRDECERDYIKTSVAEEKFARREEEWRIERERLEEEKHNAIMQSYIPGLNGSKPGSGKDNPSSYETKQREWNVERTKLLEELDRTKSQFATLTCDKLEDDDKSQKIKSLEKVIKTLKAKTKASSKEGTDKDEIIARLKEKLDRLKQIALDNGSFFPGAEENARATAAAAAAAAASIAAPTNDDTEESDADQDEPAPRLSPIQPRAAPFQPMDTGQNQNIHWMSSTTQSHTPRTTVGNARTPYPVIFPPVIHNVSPKDTPRSLGPATDIRHWTESEIEGELRALKKVILKKCKDWRFTGVIHVGNPEDDMLRRFDTLNQAWDELTQSRLTEDMLLATDILDILFAFVKTQWRNKVGNPLVQRAMTLLTRAEESFGCATNDDCDVFYIPQNEEGTLFENWE